MANSVSSMKAEIDQHFGAREAIRKGNPDNSWSMGICRVLVVNYEEMLVTLRTLYGTAEEFDRVPVPLTMPGVGMRHFLGAMPEVGDLCICGWMPQATIGNSANPPPRAPVIVNWLPRGPWLGQDWVIEQPFDPEEHGFTTSREQLIVEMQYQRTRHKMRHLQPGNILASSGQGSDLVLDESATLSNRRGNEIRLRDQDQAFIARSLQQFHAMAGTRIYGGMVQRDATLLARTIVSDGLLWDGARQFDDDGKPYYGGLLAGSSANNPLYSQGLPPNTQFPLDYLRPGRVLARPLDADGGRQNPILNVDSRLDPYTFLGNGLFIDQNGYVQRSDGVSVDNGSGYGGKRMFRTALLSNASPSLRDATSDPSLQTFTEYRIEVAHTSDGTLPVSEQTDGFDADRLPDQAPPNGEPQASTNNSPNNPYITFALGTVVGNDPYTIQGRKVYGVPLSPIILGSDPSSPNPTLVSALSPPLALGEQAATLFSLTPVGANAGPNTFWSVKKNGQFRANIGGPTGGNSVELATTGNLAATVGGDLDIIIKKSISVSIEGGSQDSNSSYNMVCPTGTINIYAGGRTEGPAASAADQGDPDDGAAALPSMTVGGLNVLVSGDSNATLQGADNAIVSSPANALIQGGQTVMISGGKKVIQSAEQIEVNAFGKMQVTLAGPSSLNPANGAVRETVIQNALGGTVDKYSVPVTGDREEEFTFGSHTTSIKVGDLTYETNLGTFTAQAGLNSLEIDTFGGMEASIALGDIEMTSYTGSATLKGLTSADLEAIAGTATVKGTTVILSAIGGKVGGIMSGADIEPFTGLPFATLGCGSATQRLSL